MTGKKQAAIAGGVLLVAAVVVGVIFWTQPTAERGEEAAETAVPVEVLRVQPRTHRPVFRVLGTVRPSRDVTLRPRVEGSVVRVAPDFDPGGTLRAGAPVVEIDPADYRNVLAQRESDLEDVLAALAIEEGRQDVARQDFRLLRDTLDLQDRSLVLREPQLRQARAAVASARAALEQAELDLGRTTVRAPFDAHVLTRSVTEGSQVGPSDALGRLVGLDTWWVEATVPQSALRWLAFEEEGAEVPSPVRVRNRNAWDSARARTGVLARRVAALEDPTRLARVIVEIPDPMALGPGTQGPPLLVGAFVEALITGRPLENVVRLDRDFVREDDTVWVMADGELDVRDVVVLLRDADHAYVTSGLEAGDRVVTTDLATVVEGTRLRLRGEGTSDAPDTATPDTAASDAAASDAAGEAGT